ncbi:MAG: hypothetical protein IT159_14810 [Bryobacterales bacterium]|nr:hypothetical protein [Bryobacterales bacterium]
MGTSGKRTRPCSIRISLFSGNRTAFEATDGVLITLRDGNQKQIYRHYVRNPVCTISNLPFHDNFADNYTVLAWAKGYRQAGFTPVKVTRELPASVDLMLLGEDAGFNFSQARWGVLRRNPRYADLLAAGASGPEQARDRYNELLESRPASLACFLNLMTAMAAIHLPSGNPVDYIKELIWDETMAQDRFFAWADRNLADQVVRASAAGLFAPVRGAAVFHPGATRSFKQVQFGEANVQLTFHENDKRTVQGVECVKVEPDMDYYKDPAAHTLLEVAVNALTGSATDPRQVYVLRWMAGRQAGVAEFEPPYTLT